MTLVRIQVGPLKFKNMKKVKDFLKGLVATLIVMLGAFLLNFYLTNPFGIVTLLTGICGFLILYPAVKKWEGILTSKNANQE